MNFINLLIFAIVMLLGSAAMAQTYTKTPFATTSSPVEFRMAYTNNGLWFDSTFKATKYAGDSTIIMFDANGVAFKMPKNHFLTAAATGDYLTFSDTLTTIATKGELDSFVRINRAQALGLVFQDSFIRSSLGSNYSTTIPNATITFPSSAYMEVTGGVGNFSNSISRELTIGSQQWEQQIVFVPTDFPSSASGLGIGIKTISGNTGLFAWFSVRNGEVRAKLSYRLSDTTSVAQSPTIAASISDVMQGRIVRNDTNIFIVYKNLTTGDSVTINYGIPTTPLTIPGEHRTGKPSILIIGGTQEHIRWQYSDYQAAGNDLVMGDSHTAGLLASQFANKFLSLGYNSRSDYYLIGGSGSPTADMLPCLYLMDSLKFYNLRFYLGSNNALNNTLATFSSDVETIFDSAVAHGIKIQAFAVMPQPNAPAFNDTLRSKTLAHGGTFINSYDILNGGSGDTMIAYYSADGLHLNDAGHALIAQLGQPTRGVYSNNDVFVQYSEAVKYKDTSYLLGNKADKATLINTTSPLSGGGDLSADRTLTITDAAADGTTKGAATFTATDFDASSGVISLDYINMLVSLKVQQALDSMVDKFSAESIGGAKTFTSAPIISQSNALAFSITGGSSVQQNANNTATNTSATARWQSINELSSTARMELGGSASTGTFGGVSTANRAMFTSTGGSSTGVAVGPSTSDSLFFVTNNVMRGGFTPSGAMFINGTSILLGGIAINTGTGDPEAVVTAPVGSLWLRTDGGALTTLYVKESGTGNTGWVAK